jgi:uridine phosphorylase
MSALGMLNVEMESAALYVVARQRGLRAGMICSVSSNLVEGASVYETHEQLAAGWHRSIEVALRTAVALAL